VSAIVGDGEALCHYFAILEAQEDAVTRFPEISQRG
jgi:hypothetical protein